MCKYMWFYMMNLRDVNSLFIKKIIAWLFGKSCSEGLGGGGGRKSSPNLGGQSRNMLPLTKKQIEKQISSILRSK